MVHGFARGLALRVEDLEGLGQAALGDSLAVPRHLDRQAIDVDIVYLGPEDHAAVEDVAGPDAGGGVKASLKPGSR